MNWTDEEIDKLFQESASQMNVPYQDSFWSEMEALLPQKEKKKGLGWIFGGTLTCFALIAGMIFPANQFSGSSKNKAVKNNYAQAAEKQTGTPIQNTSIQYSHTESIAVNENSGVSGVTPMETKTKVPASGKRSKAGDNLSVLKLQKMHDLDLLADMGTPEMKDVKVQGPQDQASVIQPEELQRLPLLAFPDYSNELVKSGQSQFTFRPRNNSFYVQLGFGMTQSYISATDKNWMPSINIGGGYQYRPQGFGFSAGINLSSSFANNLEITRKSRVYNFSYTDYQQNLAYKQLYSVELPLSIDFRKNIHTLSVSITPTYLVTTAMRVSQFENGEQSINEIYLGQKVGLNSFGLKPGIAYQLAVGRTWNIGVQLNAQMIKQVDEKQFVGSLTKIPLSGQITIRKTLMR